MENMEAKYFNNTNFKTITIVVGILASLSALYSLYENTINAFKAGAYFRGNVYIVSVIVASVWGYKQSRKRVPTQPPQKRKFQGVGKLDIEESWPRKAEKQEVCSKIQQLTNKPIVLVGSSGVGKSTLLETQVIPNLVGNWKTKHFRNYELLKDQLFKESCSIFPGLSYAEFMSNPLKDIQEFNDNNMHLLVFDQFEQFLSANLESDDEGKGTREWFKTFLENCSKYRDISVLIVIRKEWYYDLRFLAELIPPLSESINITGIRDEESNWVDLRRKIDLVTKDEIVTEAVMSGLTRRGDISPVEAQIVGLMLENKGGQGQISYDYYFNELHGNDGLIESYFCAYLDSAPNKELASQVLFALSVESRLRSQLSQQEIADIIHQPSSEVFQCLSFFKEQGLVLETHNGEYELAHDYLAEKYHDLSGAELNPVERDNILFFWNEMRKSRKAIKFTPLDAGARLKLVFGDYFMVFSAMLLLARLYSPLYNVYWGWFNPMAAYQTKGTVIDFYYLPIFISHGAWTIYVTLFYRNFFTNLRENALYSSFSKLTTITCAACVVIGVFFPHAWIASIGVGGIVIGFKLYQLSRTPGLSRIAVEPFRKLAGRTIINTSIVLLMGLAVVIYINNTVLTETLVEQFNDGSYIFSMLMTYYMIAVTPDHVTKKAASRMLGLIDRGRVRMQRLNYENPN